MGTNFGDTMKSGLAGGMSGLGQGLKQYGNPNPQFNFSMPQQQGQKKKPLQAGISGNQSPFPNPSSLYGDTLG